jgi:selenium metabolism protein YedF
MVIDARGIGCPKPVIMAEEALSKIEEGILEILVDNEASERNLSRFATKNAFYSETTKENNYWRVKIVKGYPCELPSEEAAAEHEKDLLLIIGTDTMGKEEELGKILMRAFFETMKVTKEVPHTIFFLNAGVKLTTTNEDIIPTLKEIEAMGVEIFSCGTCLKHYNLESELKVGYRGTTNHIVEGMKDFKKTVWIG